MKCTGAGAGAGAVCSVNAQLGWLYRFGVNHWRFFDMCSHRQRFSTSNQIGIIKFVSRLRFSNSIASIGLKKKH